MGITDYAQRQLGDVVFVDLPDVGRHISAGESFGSIESVKAVSELFAPMSGEVVEVNPRLKDHPEAVNSEPHESWMVKVRPSEPGGRSRSSTRQPTRRSSRSMARRSADRFAPAHRPIP